MPSNLRLQLDVHSTQSFYPHSASFPKPAPKQKMSLSQTYRVASTARGKLGMEAARPDHNLRLLVGHANLLDSLMIELSNAEREQEAWFNNTIRNSNQGEAPKHIQWFDTISEEEIQDDIYEDSSDSDSDDDEFEYESEVAATPVAIRRRSVSPPPPAAMEFDYEDDSDDEYIDIDSESEELALQRVPSHTPPELMHDSDSEDETSMPPSPSHSTIDFAENALDKSMMVTTTSKTRSQIPEIMVEELITASSAPMIAAY